MQERVSVAYQQRQMQAIFSGDLFREIIEALLEREVKIKHEGRAQQGSNDTLKWFVLQSTSECHTGSRVLITTSARCFVRSAID